MTDNFSTNSDQSPQDSEQKASSQQIFLIGLLALVFIIVLVVSILILSRPDSVTEQPSPDPTTIIQSPEITPSITPQPSVTPSPRYTFTPKPSRTPTIAPTSTGTPRPTLIPSLTPAFPSEHDDQYKLVPWTPELATQLIDLLGEYPETLSSFARGADNQGYYDAFQYALFAQQEALLRFPTAYQAQDWLWQLAYNMARTGDPSAGEIYAILITQELNRGNVSLEDLFLWGIKHTPPMTIEVITLDSDSGESNSRLIKVSADENGSSFFWLVEETGRFHSYPLTSDFNFVQPSDVDYFLLELSGIQNKVVGIFPTKVYDSFNYIFPRVFSLTQQPPQELGFDPISPPAIGPEFINNWEPVESEAEAGDIQFVDDIYPACPVTLKHTYQWNNNSFSLLNVSYQIKPDPDLLYYCEIVVNHSANVWGLEPTIQFMETLLPSWPPEQTSTGDKYPQDALDEWRYRLSIYHALLGNQAAAIDYAETIVSDPASPESRWIAPAQEFLDTYQEQRDIYKACLSSPFCDPKLAFQSLVGTITPQDYSDMIYIIEQAGVAVRSNGFFDFDNDGETEPWLVIRHQPGSPLEFWIISTNDNGTVAVFVETIDSDNPRISFLEPISEPPVVKIDPDTTFIFVKQEPNQEPVIQMVEEEIMFSSDRTKIELDHLETTLLTGGDPEFVQTQLIVVSKSPYFTCSYLLCPRFLYLLGLSSELANDEFSAVAAYLDLWREFPDSPYTTMARYKLLSTITPAPTLTPTLVTVTPTGSGTPIPPTATNTNTPEGYPAPTETATNTQEGYPAPATATSTLSGYPTP
jgi:hypothetical protein